MEPKDFKILMNLYVVIYFGLLVEEMAVSRAIIDNILSGRPIISAILLSVVCLVMLTYLYIGGFRAVLISDFVQVVVLSAFVWMLLHMSLAKSPINEILTPSIDVSPQLIALNSVTIVLLAIAWFIASVDFSSRMNFDTSGEDILRKRIQLVKFTFITLMFTLLAGILFSQATKDVISPGLLPNDYLRALTSLFVLRAPRVFQVIFLLSVFCMIFTTIDTLLLTLLQVSHSTTRNPIRRDTLMRTMIAAAVVSSLLHVDTLYVFGIFAASMIILPMFPIMKSIFDRSLSWMPNRPYYLWASFFISATLFIFYRDFLKGAFSYQFMMPAGPFFLTLACLVIQLTTERVLRRRTGG